MTATGKAEFPEELQPSPNPLPDPQSYRRARSAVKREVHTRCVSPSSLALFSEERNALILAEFYHEAAGRPVLTGTVIAHQTFGDQLRFNPHFHAIVLEGGFDEEGTFFYIPLSGLQSMTELFREVGATPSKRARARLLMKVYEVDPFVCQSEVRT